MQITRGQWVRWAGRMVQVTHVPRDRERVVVAWTGDAGEERVAVLPETELIAYNALAERERRMSMFEIVNGGDVA